MKRNRSVFASGLLFFATSVTPLRSEPAKHHRLSDCARVNSKPECEHKPNFCEVATVRSEISASILNSKNRPHHAAVGSQRCPVCR
jgi:hypothetical protein